MLRAQPISIASTVRNRLNEIEQNARAQIREDEDRLAQTIQNITRPPRYSTVVRENLGSVVTMTCLGAIGGLQLALTYSTLSGDHEAWHDPLVSGAFVGGSSMVASSWMLYMMRHSSHQAYSSALARLAGSIRLNELNQTLQTLAGELNSLEYVDWESIPTIEIDVKRLMDLKCCLTLADYAAEGDEEPIKEPVVYIDEHRGSDEIIHIFEYESFKEYLKSQDQEAPALNPNTRTPLDLNKIRRPVAIG